MRISYTFKPQDYYLSIPEKHIFSAPALYLSFFPVFYLLLQHCYFYFPFELSFYSNFILTFHPLTSIVFPISLSFFLLFPDVSRFLVLHPAFSIHVTDTLRSLSYLVTAVLSTDEYSLVKFKLFLLLAAWYLYTFVTGNRDVEIGSVYILRSEVFGDGWGLQDTYNRLDLT